MSEKIYIFDTTLRDGEQSPGCSMNLQEKLKMARQLERLNVDIIEAGFPIASQGDFEAVQAIAGEVREPTIAGLCRANRMDIERAWEALREAHKPRIHTFIATSDIHLKHKLRRSRSEVLEASVEAVKIARDLCEDVEFSAEDATRSDINYLVEVFDAVLEAGATTVNIPDTVGYSVPGEYGALIQGIRSRPLPSRARHFQHSLPQRSGSGRGQYAGRVGGRLPPGGMHHQRHRRTGRERFAGRDRHDAADAGQHPALLYRHPLGGTLCG